jgi:hypothetical protein
MARLISDILGAPEPHFTHEIQRLELLAGRPSVDTRLISELVSLNHSLANELKLDAKDTTIKELYFAMRRKALLDSEALADKLNIAPDYNPDKVLEKCIEYVNEKLANQEVWTLKHSVAKAELQKNPPKKLLKILGLRSIDSAIKRESISQISLLARLVESKAWNDTYISQASKIRNNDFDKKIIEISTVSTARVNRLEKAGMKLGHLVYKHEETAGIVVVVPKRRFAADVLFIVDALTREANEIRRYSAFCKYLSVRADFSAKLASLRRNGLDRASIEHFSVGWAPIYHLLHARSGDQTQALFEPHLNHDDVLIVDHGLGDIWNYKYSLAREGRVVVSFNSSDVIINAANNSEITDASTVHGRRALFSELFSRYLDNDVVLEDFLSN